MLSSLKVVLRCSLFLCLLSFQLSPPGHAGALGPLSAGFAHSPWCRNSTWVLKLQKKLVREAISTPKYTGRARHSECQPARLKYPSRPRENELSCRGV